jgi:hypothetical protein
MNKPFPFCKIYHLGDWLKARRAKWAWFGNATTKMHSPFVAGQEH